MKILLQIAIIFGLYWISMGIEAVLPFPFPASVISLLVLLVLLILKVIKVEAVKEKADFMLGNLGFFFIPVSVSFMNYVDVITANLLPFVTVCWVSLLLTYGATVWAVKLTMTLMKKKEEKK